jgi:hypothetical protein
MAQSFGISEFRPLSIGAVVTGAVQLYRDNFKQYFKIAFFAILWAFVPIYGWAKSIAEAGLIARLAFNQITDRTEDFEVAHRVVDERKWKFLGAVLLYIAIFIPFYFGVVIVGAIPVFVFTALGILQTQNPFALGFAVLLLFLIVFTLLLWFATRFIVQDVALAVEEGLGASRALKRSWSLTKGSVFRLQLVVLVATLITGPFYVFSQIFSFATQRLMGSDPSPTNLTLYFLMFSGLTVANSALLTPFWQAVKALIYADLLTRREGADLDLRGQ